MITKDDGTGVEREGLKEMPRVQFKKLFGMSSEEPFVEWTGIDGEYFDEIAKPFLLFYRGGSEKVINALKDNPVRKYEECFPPSEFIDVITEKNRDRVLGLDELVDSLNSRIATGEVSREEVVEFYKRAYKLMYGKEFGKTLLG